MEILFMYDEKYDVYLPIEEIWKDIEGFEGYYQVSNYGSVKSLSRIVTWVTASGREGHKVIKERLLKPKVDKDGYYEYVLSFEGKRTYRRAHRLVALHFIPTPDNYEELVIDHKDANKKNNIPSNLQWVTSEQNTIKYYSEEFGKDKTLSSLSKQEWLQVGELYNQGVAYSDICDMMSLTVESPDTIWSVLSGGRLSSVTGFKPGDFKKRPHPVQKLSEIEVLEILHERLHLNRPLKVLSRKYGIAESMISRFCSGTRRPEILQKYREKRQ
jgi:hypothetical protein